jgi:hypothetical protein
MAHERREPSRLVDYCALLGISDALFCDNAKGGRGGRGRDVWTAEHGAVLLSR